MTAKTTLKSAIAAAALMLTIAAQAQAETGFDTLTGIDAEAMNAEEMEAVQGKALVNAYQSGQYLLFIDDQLRYPAAAFDLNLPGVQQVLTWIQYGLIPNDLNTAFYQLSAVDPQGTIRPIPGIGGCMTSMGPGNPGFTVGC